MGLSEILRNKRSFLIGLPLILWILDDFAIGYLKVHAPDNAFYLHYILAIIILLPLIIVTRKNVSGSPSPTGSGWKVWGMAAVAIVCGIVLGYLGAAVEYAIRPSKTVYWNSSLDYLGQTFLPETKELRMFHIVFGSLLVVVTKELFFRRFLISELEQHTSSNMAVLITAILFTAAFWGSGPIAWISAVFWGLVYGWGFVRWRSIKFAVASEWAQAFFWYSYLLEYLDL